MRHSVTFLLGTGVLVLCASLSAADLRLGVMGTDTSHVIAFAGALNDPAAAVVTGRDYPDTNALSWIEEDRVFGGVHRIQTVRPLLREHRLVQQHDLTFDPRR